ncbi:MAG: tetratricopeptide (TPR) repeat protein [Chlamydiales bacterium]|jgi:tetratricopeptide (TPR) repeat protein
MMNHPDQHPTHPVPAVSPSKWADGTVVGTLISRGVKPPSVRLNVEGDARRQVKVGPVEPDLLATSRGRGNYRVQGEIGRDALSYVLKVEDTDLGRTVAMKVLRDEHLANASAIRVFVQEAQVAAQLQHEGILPVYDFGLHPDGRPYYTMKIVRGDALSVLLSARLSVDAEPRRFLSIFEQVCRAVAYAHTRGIAHCGIDGRHVMVGAQDEAQVVHWASARFLAGDESAAGEASRPVAAADNVAHMAPEAARADYRSCDERTDVFALGSMLCEILTGTPAYRGRSDEDVRGLAAQARLDDAYLRLDRCESHSELVALARDCLVAGQSGRPQSAAEVLTRLNRSMLSLDALRGEAESTAKDAMETAASERRSARKSRLLAEALVLVGLLVAAGSYVVLDRSEKRRESVLADVQQEVECAQFLWRQAQMQSGEDTSLWDEALLAISRAGSHVAGAEIDPSVKKRVEFVEANLRIERLAAIDSLQRQLAERELLESLGAGAVAHGEELTIHDHARLAARSAEVLGAHGLDPEAGLEGDVAQVIAASSIKADILAAYDRWAVACLQSGQSKAHVLLDVAMRADNDPSRSALREAMGAGSRALVVAAAQNLDPEGADPQTAVLAAAALRMHGLTGQAVAVLSAAHGRAPGHFALNTQLAECFEDEQVRDWGQAVRFYTSALGRRPDSADARYRLSRALERAGRISEAMDTLERAIEKRPGDAELQAHLGSLYFGLGERARALKIWRGAAQLEGVQPSCLATLGDDMRAAGDHPGARLALARWVRMSPSDPQAHLALGGLLGEQGKLDKAQQVLTLAVELDPEWSQPLIALADLYARTDRSDEALENYFAALRLQPEDASLQRKMGAVFESRKEWDSAAGAFKESLLIDPAHEQTAAHLFSLMSERAGSPDAAAHTFEDIAAAQPDSATGWYYLGRAEMDRNDLSACASALDRSVALRPDDARSRALLGRAQLGLGEIDAALVEFRRAVDLDPEQARLHADLGLALSRAGDLDGAVDSLRSAIELQPTDPDTHYRLGSALQRRGDLEDARLSYVETIRLRPDHAEAHCNLGGLLKLQGDYEASLEVYRLAHEIGSGRLDWEHPSADWVADAEQLVVAQRRLEAVVQGAEAPKEPEALLQLASMAQNKGLNTTSARLYADAIERAPEGADGPLSLDRFQAACAAVQAGSGIGDEGAAMPAQERARWRSTGLDWLERELVSLLEQNGAGRLSDEDLRGVLARWRREPALAGIRDQSELARRAGPERESCLGFWAGVDGLLDGK